MIFDVYCPCQPTNLNIMLDNEKLIIHATREAYSMKELKTMTISELIAHLTYLISTEGVDEETPVYLSFDSGYTYGGIRESIMEHQYDEEEFYF